jgi:hypothetical protein
MWGSGGSFNGGYFLGANIDNINFYPPPASGGNSLAITVVWDGVSCDTPPCTIVPPYYAEIDLSGWDPTDTANCCGMGAGTYNWGVPVNMLIGGTTPPSNLNMMVMASAPTTFDLFITDGTNETASPPGNWTFYAGGCSVPGGIWTNLVLPLTAGAWPADPTQTPPSVTPAGIDFSQIQFVSLNITGPSTVPSPPVTQTVWIDNVYFTP